MSRVRKQKIRYPKITIEEESWITKYWRPMMAWQYFVVCVFDFIVFPSMAMYYARDIGGHWKWEPLTLVAGGFYHIAMGLIIGVTAYTRGQENLLRTRLFANLSTTNNSHNEIDVDTETNDTDVLYSDDKLKTPKCNNN